MKFPYIVLPGNSDKTVRPLLQARLTYKNKTTSRLFFMVDSGADFSYVDKNIAVWLGIDLTKSKPATSTAANHSTFESYPAKTILTISGHEMAVPIFYTENLGYPCILGQEVVFNKFRIIFEKYKGQFELVPKYI